MRRGKAHRHRKLDYVEPGNWISTLLPLRLPIFYISSPISLGSRHVNSTLTNFFFSVSHQLGFSGIYHLFRCDVDPDYLFKSCLFHLFSSSPSVQTILQRAPQLILCRGSHRCEVWYFHSQTFRKAWFTCWWIQPPRVSLSPFFLQVDDNIGALCHVLFYPLFFLILVLSSCLVKPPKAQGLTSWLLSFFFLS